MKFKDRYVLGEGIVNAMRDDEVFAIELYDVCKPEIRSYVNAEIAWPAELDDDDAPRYRLILERVEEP